MANLWFKNILGQIPSTDKVENAYNQLTADYERFNQIANSQEFLRYKELESYLASNEFLNEKQKILDIKFQGSAEEKQINDFNALKSDKEIVSYLKTKDSEQLKRYTAIESGDKYARFIHLSELEKSGQANEVKTQMDKDHAAEVDKATKFKQLKSNADLKKYFKLLNHQSFKIYNEVAESGIPEEFNTLKTTVEKFNYSQITKENKSEFSEQLSQKERYTRIQNDANFKTYNKFIASGNHTFMQKIAESNILKEYEALDIYLQSAEYKAKLDATDFKKSEIFGMLQELGSLKKDSDIKFYNKFKESPAYKNYVAISNSDKLKRFEQLKELTESNDFKSQIEYLKDAKKFEKSELYNSVAEFEQLKNSEPIKWYFEKLSKNPFEALNAWKIVFEDNFTESNLNESQWSPIVFQGLVSINENYVTEGEQQFYTKGNNLKIQNSELIIETRQEHLKGKCWSASQGFTEKEFQYSSGTLNTAQSFRVNKGRIEAKISVEQSSKVIHGLSLKGEKMIPHIDLFKTGKGNGFEFRFIPKEGVKSIQTDKVTGINVNGKYYIYGLEWSEKELVWTLNGLEVGRMHHNLNGEQLYLNIASIVENTPEQLPINFKIDWIRVFSKQ